ncbi:pilus assembly protein PilW [Stutzerimonas stutzeri]|uniref:Pilus assembly protein PilW n=1 Tax=Stutzerimonas stutzeri TaxID=316 RepID=W8R455_STUST|nr:prepilin-type N-terminal cleavage/methylation domain-containing protein [Stutzerimonas stutzeri]AHL74288.1 pilus assembly protein PilW [Stutzerimonas stutzeri]MCQ4330777.1 prepilin-type N-terminal cleavage/methylation domain-containing protein [Stutzerimonas stutzeri]
MNNMKRQFGLSMIELLIALAISSFLMLGITQVYIDNKRNYVFQQNQAGNLENSRFAALMIGEYLGKAGYRRNPSMLLETIFPEQPAAGGCLAFDTGHAITGLNPNDPDGGGTGFCVRYQPQASGELDCQGAASSVEYDEAFPSDPPDENELTVLALKYEPSTGGELQNGRLLCKNLNATSPQYGELLRGIADVRLDFGVGNTDVLNKEVTTFIPQADWIPSSGAIRSVRYALLLASRTGQRDSDDSKVFSDWLNEASAEAKARLQEADSKRIYQIAGSSQTLRNLMP